MGLTTTQMALFEKIRRSSTSKASVSLTDDALRALIYTTAGDLDVLALLPSPPAGLPNFFDTAFLEDMHLGTVDPRMLFERLSEVRQDADVYVWCLASLHKARLKYRQVISSQPFPLMDQVGPRGLLQYGLVDSAELAAFLVWRKWIYDIDNRAAQDTGYLVEPVIAAALGGVSYSAKTSPVKRSSNNNQGRQVDCIKGQYAYEFKLRMTIASSGQGRWNEELSFAADCRASGFVPVFLVLDPTESAKLTQLATAFRRVGGECYIGEAAWQHLLDQASAEMQTFIEKYLREPLVELFSAYSSKGLPRLEVVKEPEAVRFSVGSYSWLVSRRPDPVLAEEEPPTVEEDLLPGL